MEFFINITPALIGLIGVLIGAAIVHHFTIARDGESRKRAFRAYIRGVQYDLNILMQNWKQQHPGDPYFLYDLQKETVAEISSRCSIVLEDIPVRHQAAFVDLMMQFSRQGRRNVDPYEGKQPEKPLLFSDHQKKLFDILQNMIDYAK